jgi:hypothetical protein
LCRLGSGRPAEFPREPAAVQHGPGVGEAAATNAAWCDAVARTHHIAGVFAADAWTAAVRTPALYPDAVTLRPDADADSVVARIDAGPGASVKDSFATLDLARYGFAVLFEATWIARTPGVGSLVGPTLRFDVLHGTAFPEWEAAWRGDDGPPDVLRVSLLDEPGVIALSAVGTATPAGVLLFATSALIGVTNVFASDDDRDAAWRGIVAWTELHRPDLALVGYEAGPDLGAAVRCGFEPIGPLRIWTRDH